MGGGGVTLCGEVGVTLWRKGQEGCSPLLEHGRGDHTCSRPGVYFKGSVGGWSADEASSCKRLLGFSAVGSVGAHDALDANKAGCTCTPLYVYLHLSFFNKVLKL